MGGGFPHWLGGMGVFSVVVLREGATPKGIGMGLMTLEKQVQVLAVPIYFYIS